MRAYICYCLLATLGTTAVTSPLCAFVTLGHGRLVGTATARADYDSNIFVNNTDVDDMVGTITGGVRYVRDSSAVTFDAGVGVTLLAFADRSEQNSADPYLDAILGYVPSDKTTFRGTIGYRRNSTANETVNDRTESDDLALSGSFTHLTTEKVGFRMATDYYANDYHTPGYSDVLHYSVGLHGVYAYSPKLKLLAGLTKLEWWTENRAGGRRSPNSKDMRFTVSAEGDLAPKITGDVSVGVVQREAGIAGFNDAESLYLSNRISWAVAEKTLLTTELSQDVSVSAADQSVKSLSFTVGFTQSVSEKLSFDGSAGLDHSKFESFRGIGDRQDDGWVIRSRLNYMFTDVVSFDVACGYRRNDSNQAVASYNRFNFGVGASVRF